MIREIDGPVGHLEVRLDEPPGPPRVAVVFGSPHPQYGGTLHAKVVFQAAKALTHVGAVVLRFNYRGAGASEGTYDSGPGEQSDFKAALDFMAKAYPGLPLWAAGYSFGAWVALTVGALDDRVTALIAIAPPVDGHDFSLVQTSGKPVFLIQGEADQVCPLKSTQRFYGMLNEPRELVVIDAADHSFDGHVSEVGDALEDLLSDFGVKP